MYSAIIDQPKTWIKRRQIMFAACKFGHHWWFTHELDYQIKFDPKLLTNKNQIYQKTLIFEEELCYQEYQ